jgi:DoxX-like family
VTSTKTLEDKIMHSTMPHAPISKGRLWAGRIVSALPVLSLLFSGVMKLVKPPAVLQGFAQYGYPESQILIIGILELSCTVIYAIPRTSVLGAILLTGYLGGATATNVRVGNPAFYITVFLGLLAWVGLYLREDRLHALVPLRK